jgi:aconitate hydratase
VERGLKVKPYVKTSLAPGSRVVTEYLESADLMEPLSQLGFNLVGYGCTTCIGNSGPLSGEVVKAINAGDLVTTAVLSGNRNFEGRIHPYALANYLASPPLVVAFALAGTVDIDMTKEPLGIGKNGEPVFLKDIWPTREEIQAAIQTNVRPEMFAERYSNVFTGNETWNNITAHGGELYEWNESSTYIHEPPYFVGLTRQPDRLSDVRGARVLLSLGDSVTTDHISPAGAIPADGPAGKWLVAHGVTVPNFNSFGSRRGNDQVMTRGTFANIRIKNALVPGVEGGYTTHFPSGDQLSVFDAAMRYQEDGVPLIVLGGREFGSGSSRDWAAKGPRLLGVKAEIAESFEKIHRSNLVYMGVLPLEYREGETMQSLGLDGSEVFDIEGINNDMQPNAELKVRATAADGRETVFWVNTRLDTPLDVEVYKHGSILHAVLRELL